MERVINALKEKNTKHVEGLKLKSQLRLERKLNQKLLMVLKHEDHVHVNKVRQVSVSSFGHYIF